MMRSVSSLKGASLKAIDGEIGRVEDCFFDDRAWAIRYLVVDTGEWLASRKVLISPYSVTPPLRGEGVIDVALTREKIRMSPDVDTHKPVSRQNEHAYHEYFGYPAYWLGGGMWSLGAFPGAYTAIPPPVAGEAERRSREMAAKPEDVHLRSAEKVSGYHLQASDESIGHIEDFLFDEKSWAIRYLVIDTRNWWPGGERVLVATHWIESIDWAEQKVFTTLSRNSVKAGLVYDESAVIDRDYETRLHSAQSRKGYWEAASTRSRHI